MHLIYRVEGDRFTAPVFCNPRLPLWQQGTDGGRVIERDGERFTQWSLDATSAEFITACLVDQAVGQEHAEIPETKMAIVFDIAPERATRELYRLIKVWGYSEPRWTPLLFRIEILGDHPYPEPENDKTKPVPDFTAVRGEICHEFLYFQRGHEGGRKDFGRVGGVNGAILGPAHLKFFLPHLEPAS